MAFASVERYFLIFHDRFVYRWRFFVHYLPILVCFCYPLGFYGVIVNVYPCDHVYLYDAYVCGGDCFQFETAAGTVDYLIHVVVPIGVIILGNLTLLVRVTLKKRTMKRANTWRKSRLMYIQLLSISILYSFIWIPFVIVSLIRLFHDPFFLQDFTLLILNYCLYICPLASPFIALIGLPRVRQYLRANRCVFFCKCCIPAHNRIRPVMSMITRTNQPHPSARVR